jgi:hypothetical protein
MVDSIWNRLELKRRLPQIRLGAVVALAAVAGVVAWLVLRDGDESQSPNEEVTTVGPESITLADLRTRAADSDQPIYWVGRLPGRGFEVSETTGRIYVRYLPRGVPAGSVKPFLTVATYRHSDAFAATRAVSQREGTVRLDVGRAGVAFYAKDRPTSVYVAYRGSPYQIEVFHPVPRILHGLVSSRRVRPIAGAR